MHDEAPISKGRERKRHFIISSKSLKQQVSPVLSSSAYSLDRLTNSLDISRYHNKKLKTEHLSVLLNLGRTRAHPSFLREQLAGQSVRRYEANDALPGLGPPIPYFEC